MVLHVVSKQKTLANKFIPILYRIPFFTDNDNYTLHKHWRFMTTTKRVQDRSKRKRVQNLEIVVEQHKILSKVLFLLEILKQEPEQIVPVKSLNQYRRQIILPKPHKISTFLEKSPKLFELYKDRGILWCGMTKTAEMLVEEEREIIDQNSDKAAEYVTRMLMMSVDKRLPLDKIVHFRRDLGLPFDFRSNWVHKYPENFRVTQPLKPHDDGEYLELVSWKPSWSITELEKKKRKRNKELGDDVEHVPGLLSLAFPLKFPPNYNHVCRFRGKINKFQEREYLSPYADAKGLEAGTLEFDKRAVAVMHELLSFTIEKRLVTDHLTHFRREFVMPQKLMRLLLKHFGIFYVSEKGKRFSVFLNEAYEGHELIVKHPLVLWREKVESAIGYRKKKVTEDEDLLLEMQDGEFLDSGSESERVWVEEENESVGLLHDVRFESSSEEMEVEEIQSAYHH